VTELLKAKVLLTVLQKELAQALQRPYSTQAFYRS
jgi:hypothetical protein